MAKTAKNILSLNHEEVMDYFMNMAYTRVNKQGSSPYTLCRCQFVAGKAVAPLWNNDWPKTELIINVSFGSVIEVGTLKKVTYVITFREVRKY